MNLDRARALCLALPHTTETLQWGESLVLWVGDKASVGGRIFAILALDAVPGDPKRPLLAFAAGPTRAPDLLERESIVPAPHLARAHWVAVTEWPALTAAEWSSELAAAHAYVFNRLPAQLRKQITGTAPWRRTLP